MITETDTALSRMLADAATTAARVMPSGEPLVPAAPRRDADELPDGHDALLVPFAGARSGELLILLDPEIAAALQEAPSGPIDLGVALTPMVAEIAAAMGPVTLAPVQVTEARLTVNRILAAADSALVPLVDGAGRPRAAVAISLIPTEERFRGADPAPADRLDLLRGVEMDATAELGRARMTVNDLLALRAGAVVELDRLAGGPADLLVNGRLIARGEVVVVDENYGIRITQVVSDVTSR